MPLHIDCKARTTTTTTTTAMISITTTTTNIIAAAITWMRRRRRTIITTTPKIHYLFICILIISSMNMVTSYGTNNNNNTTNEISNHNNDAPSTFSPTMNSTSISTMSSTYTSSIRSTYTYTSTYSSSLIPIPKEWDYSTYTSTYSSTLIPINTTETTTHTDDVDGTINKNLTKIIYCYTVTHSKKLSAQKIKKKVNASIVDTFTSILNGTLTSDVKELDESNYMDEYGFMDWNVMSATARYKPMESSTAISKTGKEKSTLVYVSILSSSPSLNNEDGINFLLSRNITNTIGNTLQNDIDSTSLPIYFQPSQHTQRFELSMTSPELSSFANDIESGINPTNTLTSNNKDIEVLQLILSKLTAHWNDTVTHSLFALDIQDNITACSNSSTNDCNLDFILKHDPSANKENGKEEEDEDFEQEARSRTRPFLSRGKQRLLSTTRTTSKPQEEAEERKRRRSGNAMYEQQQPNSFYYILLPLTITFKYYIPEDYIDSETYKKMGKILVPSPSPNSETTSSQEDDFFQDFYRELLLFMGYNLPLNSTSTLDISLSYLPPEESNEDRDKDRNTNPDGTNNNYDDDFINTNMDFNPMIFQDILESFIVMLAIFSICLILVYCGKFQDRRKMQKVVPFDGSIPQEI